MFEHILFKRKTINLIKVSNLFRVENGHINLTKMIPIRNNHYLGIINLTYMQPNVKKPYTPAPEKLAFL
jgi:hypothetical protein